MTIKELYSKDFDTAAQELWCETNRITCIEILKNFIKQKIDEDMLFLALHLLEAIKEHPAEYYDYDYSMGTLDTPCPLTTLEDLEDYCEDNEVF